MECFSAILLFDAFSARKMERFRHWIIVTSLAFLEATFLNIASNVLPAYSKILIALVLYYFVHRILYISNRFFGLYISIIIYATMCCIDNLWHTLALLLSETLNGVFLGNALCQSMLFTGKGAKWEIKSSNQFQMVHHSCSAFPCECFAYFLFWKLLSAGSNINSAAMCLCHIYYCNADSSVTFNQLDGTKRQLP